MIDIISITEEVIKKIKKIVLSVTKHTNGIFVGVDKSGYSGYSYKTNYAENTHQYKYEIIKKRIKIYIYPKITMLLLEDEMGYMVNKFHQDLFLKTKIKKMYVREGVFLVLMFDFL